eukprot:s197_g26.t1
MVASIAETIVEEDLPGHYLIVHNNAAVRAEVALDSPVVGQLASGEIVHVLEVLPLLEENRVRGKLEHPHGWISLVNLQDGYRWAERQETAPADPWAIEKAHLVAELRSRDAEIKRWTVMAERRRYRLRAEYQRSIENATELAAAVEDRVLMGHRIPPEALRAQSAAGSAAAFAQSTRAQELQQLATRLGGSVSPGTMSAPAPAAPAEEVDPAYQLPPGLPPGSKVVGFRRKPSKDGPEVPTGAVEGRVLDSNAMMQPSQVHTEDGPAPAVGVYPLARPPVSMATNSSLDRPLTGKSQEKWSYDGDFQGRSFAAASAKHSSECGRVVSDASRSQAGPKAHTPGESAARAIVSMLH